MIIYEEIKKQIEEKQQHFEKEGRAFDDTIKEHETKINNKQIELEKSLEDMDFERHKQLRTEIEDAELFLGEIRKKQERYLNLSKNSVTIFIDNDVLNDLRIETEQENYKLAKEFSEQLKKLEDIKHKSMELVQNYQKISKLFHDHQNTRNDNFSGTNVYDYRGYDLLGLPIENLRIAIDYGIELSKNR